MEEFVLKLVDGGQWCRRNGLRCVVVRYGIGDGDVAWNW